MVKHMIKAWSALLTSGITLQPSSPRFILNVGISMVKHMIMAWSALLTSGITLQPSSPRFILNVGISMVKHMIMAWSALLTSGITLQPSSPRFILNVGISMVKHMIMAWSALLTSGIALPLPPCSPTSCRVPGFLPSSPDLYFNFWIWTYFLIDSSQNFHHIVNWTENGTSFITKSHSGALFISVINLSCKKKFEWTQHFLG